MLNLMLRLPIRCIGAVAHGIKRTVHASKRCTSRLIRSKTTQRAITFADDGIHNAVPKLYYAAGALVGTVEGLWLEGRYLLTQTMLRACNDLVQSRFIHYFVITAIPALTFEISELKISTLFKH